MRLNVHIISLRWFTVRWREWVNNQTV